jgi:tetratricopeptide (TPR) repeat protein
MSTTTAPQAKTSLSSASVQASPVGVEATFSEGLKCHRTGGLREAERLYCKVLDIDPRHGDCLHLLGLILHQTGRSEVATDVIREAIAVNGSAPLYHLSLGNVLTAQGRLDEAVVCYLRVLELDPDNPDAHNNLGNVHADQGRPEEAIVCYRRALQIKPSYLGLHANLANALRRCGRLDEAVVCYHKALEADPDSPAIQNTLGNTYMQLGQPDMATGCYRRALEINPNFADAHNNLGSALAELARPEEAIACFRRAIELRPDYPDAYNNLGNALREQGKLKEAIASYRTALIAKPNYAEAYYNLANVLREYGEFDLAVACFRKSIGLNPQFADAYINLGGTLADQRKLEEAVACYDKSLALRPDLPDAHFNKALVLLALGDLAAGWSEYEWRWKMPQMIAAGPCFERPQWRGEAAEGQTLLIHAEQGFGDTLQFCRYGQLAAEKGLRVVMSVQKSLVRLLHSLPGIDQVVAEGEELPAFDVQCAMLSMPFAMNTTLANVPSHISYLKPDEAQTAAWRDRLAGLVGSETRVGLVWAGSSRNSPALAAVDRRRSVSPDRLAPLLGLPRLHFFSLQKDGPPAPPDFPLIDYVHEMTDFADTAALVANLDLVISVDTAVAHLAAALGKPVWLLDRFDSCWRWLTGRRDSPWYPSLRLYRQPVPGDWDAVIAEVAGDLEDFAFTRHDCGRGDGGSV